MTVERPRPRVLAYADVDLNTIDGSAIWLQSAVEIFARAGCDVTLLLKGKARTTHLLEPLDALPSVRFVGRTGQELGREGGTPLLSPPAAARVMRRLDAAQRFDLILIRGIRVAARLADDPVFHGRLWTYLTDLPQSVAALDAAKIRQLETIVRGSRSMLCQTEDLRSFLETIIPDAVGRTAIFPPAIPTFEAPVPRELLADRPVRLVYSGKFSPPWKTLEMTTLPTRLAERGVAAELHMIGGKIQWDPDDASYESRMRLALEGSAGVIWHNGRSRQDAMAIAATADIGLSWRDRTLDASLELSTKVLEYGSLGLPVLLNRTPMHERLLGRDYPLFVSDEGDVEAAIVEAIADPELLSDAARRCQRAAAGHTMERGTDRVRELLARAFPPPLRSTPNDRPLRVGVASHDLKFFTRIHEHFERLPDVEVRFDRWTALNVQDEASSRRLLEWADVIICEWSGPNAVWYSNRVRPGQRLIVRLHRFELYSSWPEQVAIDRVDRVVCVSRSYAALTTSMTGWPASRITVIPNWVDDRALDRPKLPGAEFHLGFIGMAPSRKRLDRALDVLEILRAQDRRFTLFVKSKLPWDYPWIWRHPAEQDHANEIMRRVQTSELLRGAVVFDEFGPDVAAWLRRIGFVLSTSDDESFHLAPAEGMASGAVPMLLDWPGAETIYDPRWIHHSPGAMAGAIASIVGEGRWEAEATIARAQVEMYSLDAVNAAWDALLKHGLPGQTDPPVPAAGGGG